MQREATAAGRMIQNKKRPMRKGTVQRLTIPICISPNWRRYTLPERWMWSRSVGCKINYHCVYITFMMPDEASCFQ